jgi:hypothetical protein
MPSLETQDLTKRYRGVDVVDRVNFSISGGEFYLRPCTCPVCRPFRSYPFSAFEAPKTPKGLRAKIHQR